MKTFLMLLVLSTVIGAQAEASGETLIERRVRIATDTVRNRMESTEPIPAEITKRAHCVLSLRAFKYGWIWGEEDRTGLVSCKTAETGEWSAPGFVNINGITFGLQYGFQLIESVVVFMRDNAKEWFLRPSFSLGIDVGIAVGPVAPGLDPAAIPNEDALLYERSIGLFAGATVGGFTITEGRIRNHEVYGKDLGTPESILNRDGASAPAIVAPYVRAVNQYFPH